MGATNKPVYCSPLPVCSNFEPLQGCSGECRAPSRDIIAGRQAPRLHAEKSFLVLTIAYFGVVCSKQDDGWAGRILYL